MDSIEHPNLTRDQFADALRKGLGRAYLHVQHYGSEGIEDLILDACLHNKAADPMFAGSRWWWMLHICREAGLLDQAREAAITAIDGGEPDDPDGEDLHQVQMILVHFAQLGDSRARSALYRSYARSAWMRHWIGAFPLLILDELDGLIHGARLVGGRLDAELKCGLVSARLVIDKAIEIHGETAVWSQLLAAAAVEPDVARFIEAVDRERVDVTKPSPPPPCTAVELLRRMASDTDDAPGSYVRAYRDLSEHHQRAVMQRIEIESDPLVLRRLLETLESEIAYEMLDRLLELAQSNDTSLRRTARNALGNIASDRVRSLSMSLATDPAQPADEILSMLRMSYRPDDRDLIVSIVLRRANWDDHNLAIQLRRLVSTHDDPSLYSTLTQAIECTTCSDCRLRFLQIARDRGVPIEEQIEEARFDAHGKIRDFAVATSNARGEPRASDYDRLSGV